MNDAAIRAHVLAVLQSIAPEISGEDISGHLPLRDQVDLDSMDWLNVLVGLHQRLDVDIPEADYAKLRTLDDLVAYLRPKGRGEWSMTEGTADWVREAVESVYKSEAHRNKVNAEVMKDPRIASMMDSKDMPFDVQRMSHGGFKILVDAWSAKARQVSHPSPPRSSRAGTAKPTPSTAAT